MATVRKPRALAVLPYCHNCKPAEATLVHAVRPTPEICDTCGRETRSGVYVVVHEPAAEFGNVAAGR